MAGTSPGSAVSTSCSTPPWFVRSPTRGDAPAATRALAARNHPVAGAVAGPAPILQHLMSRLVGLVVSAGGPRIQPMLGCYVYVTRREAGEEG